jgi:hypothetical protein
MFFALLPVAIYLTATETWWDFWQRSVVIPGSSEMSTAGADPARWLRVAWDFSSERALFVASAVGLVWFALAALRRGAGGAVRVWLDPRWGGLPLLALAWAGFNSVEFDNHPDLLPILPSVAFFAAWGASRLLDLLGPRRRARAAVGAALAIVGGFVALRDAPDLVVALSEEEIMIGRIVGWAGSAGVMAFSVEEVYVLAERASPNRFLRLSRGFEPFIELVEPGGCPAIVRRTLEQRPGVVVMNLWENAGDCERRIAKELFSHGYQRAELRVSWMTWYIFREASPPAARGR